jgi:hypothetical protein
MLGDKINVSATERTAGVSWRAVSPPDSSAH